MSKSKIYNNFEEILELVESTIEYPNQVKIKCDFDLYFIDTKLEYEIIYEKVSVYAASITSFSNLEASVCFFILNKEKLLKKSIGITITKHTLKKFKTTGLVINNDNFKYFSNKRCFLFELEACKKDYINNLFKDIIEANNMYDELYKKVLEWN